MELGRCARGERSIPDATSLDRPLSSEGDATSLGDLIEDEQASDTPDLVIRELEGTWVGEAIGRLPSHHRHVLVHRYGLDHQEPGTLAELGDQLKMSRERVRQLQRTAERMLKMEGIGEL